MNRKGFIYLFAFVCMILIVGLACTGGASSSDPVQEPVDNPPVQEPQNPSSNSGGSEPVTFTDQNDLYQIDIPGDWTYSHTTGENYYADIFLAPDEGAKVENIVYNDGTPFTGSQNGKFALNILNTFYSSTGETGDIRVTGDQLMEDGSERLTWQSRGGGYTGVSFFEIRGDDRTTFLMFTVYWSDSAEAQYQDTVNGIIESYRIP